MTESVQQCNADIQIHDLVLKAVRLHPLAQSLEAVHLRPCKAAPAVFGAMLLAFPFPFA